MPKILKFCSMDIIQQQLAAVRQRMAAASTSAGRQPGEVRLLLATKTVNADNIRRAALAGELLTGENKVQELTQKHAALQDLPLEKHFIGHLQTNKVKEVLRYVTCIQSVDRLSLAEALQKRLDQLNGTISIMVQVNTSFEDSKFGITPEEADNFIRALRVYDRLRITGLMTIGLFDADPEKVRPSFSLLRKIKEATLPADAALSMGMSGDLETAIEEGATMIRVGTAIFGQRMYPDSYYWNETNTTGGLSLP